MEKKLERIDWHQLKWTKCINAQYGFPWAYPEPKINSEFKLNWKNNPKSKTNAGKPKQGDLIILRQQTKVTHIVEVVDNHISDLNSEDEFSIYRLVKVVWRAENFETAPHQDQVFGFKPELQGGYAVDLQNKSNKIYGNFGEGGLVAFQKYVFTQLGLVV